MQCFLSFFVSLATFMASMSIALGSLVGVEEMVEKGW